MYYSNNYQLPNIQHDTHRRKFIHPSIPLHDACVGTYLQSHLGSLILRQCQPLKYIYLHTSPSTHEPFFLTLAGNT